VLELFTMDGNLILDFIMQIFCIFCFVESSAISLNLCNNVNTVCGDAQAGSFFCCLKKNMPKCACKRGKDGEPLYVHACKVQQLCLVPESIYACTRS